MPGHMVQWGGDSEGAQHAAVECRSGHRVQQGALNAEERHPACGGAAAEGCLGAQCCREMQDVARVEGLASGHMVYQGGVGGGGMKLIGCVAPSHL